MGMKRKRGGIDGEEVGLGESSSLAFGVQCQLLRGALDGLSVIFIPFFFFSFFWEDGEDAYSFLMWWTTPVAMLVPRNKSKNQYPIVTICPRCCSF